MKFYEQFDDDEIGALDNAELEGFIEPDSARLEEVIKDYFRHKERESVEQRAQVGRLWVRAPPSTRPACAPGL